MGLTVTKAKFHFSYTDEPHATRRQQILKAHPEIKQLFGIDPSFKYVVIAQVLTQILIAYLIRLSEWPLVLILAYAAGGTFNHSLSLAVHELSHNTAFGSHRPLANRILGIIANLPMFVPMSVTFKKYHLEHHRYLGEDEIDTDIPTEWEAKTFDTTGKKAVWLFLQPVFYGFRPMALYKKAITDLELVQVTFDVLVIYFWGWKSAAYLFLGLALGLGIHPCSGHYISDHYVFSDDHVSVDFLGDFGNHMESGFCSPV